MVSSNLVFEIMYGSKFDKYFGCDYVGVKLQSIIRVIILTSCPITIRKLC